MRRNGMAMIMALLLTVAIGPAVADVATLTTDTDTYVERTQPDNNSGANTWLQVFSHNTQDFSNRNALVWFDLPADLVGGSVNSATLKVQGRYVSTNCDVGVRRMTQAWLEGTGSNDPTGDGATWNTYDGTNAWPTTGTPFGDSTLDSGSIMRPSEPTGYDKLGPIYELDVTDTASAWAGGADNYGLMIAMVNPVFGLNQAFSLWSSDDTSGSTPPQLVLDYTPGATVIPGDYNDDGMVTDADYTVWADTYQSTSDLRADGNGDGTVTDADYTIWADNYGTGVSSPVAVPEPTMIGLLTVSAIGLLRRRS